MSLEPRSIPNKSREILVLSKGQLDKINGQLYEKQRQEEARKALIEKGKAIKDASQKMTDTWTNTFKGSHRQRLKNASLRALKTEALRCRIDELEGKYQELRKKYVLDVAQRKRYFETDRVKNLHAAMRLTEAISDREQQMSQRGQAARLFDELEKEYTRCVLEDVQNFKMEEKKKEEERRKNAKKLAKDLKIQANMVSKSNENEKMQDLSEGIILWELADQYVEEEMRGKAREKEKKQDYKFALEAGVNKKMDIQKSLDMIDEAEDVRNELFNDAKLNMKKLCKEKEEEAKRQKEELVKRIAEDLAKRRTTRHKEERRNLKKAERQKQAKEEKEWKKKEEKKQATQKGIDDYYHYTVKAMKVAELQDKVDHLNERRQLEDLYLRLTKKYLEEEEKRKQKEKDLKHSQLHQIAKKRSERQISKQDEDDYLGLVRSLYEEEDTFQEYAKLLIAKCEAKGLNTYPMKKAAQPGVGGGRGPLFSQKCNIRPKYYAAVEDPDDLNYTKRNVPTHDTKSRLGFCGK